MAPASGLLSSLNTLQRLIEAKSQAPADYEAGYWLVGKLTGYAALIVKGTQSTLAPVTNANATIFPNARPGLQTVLASLETQCADEVETNLTSEITTYAGSSGAKPSDYPGVDKLSLIHI